MRLAAPCYKSVAIRGSTGAKADMKLLACNANRPLAEAIADYLDMRLTRSEVKSFADEEIFVRIDENVRGEDVFVIQ